MNRVVEALIFLLSATAFSENDLFITQARVLEAKSFAATKDNVSNSEFIQNNISEFIPNDPLFADQWSLKNPTTNFDIGATGAWAIERGNDKIAIVVIDSGINYHHPDLIGNVWTNPGEIPNNGVDDDKNGYIDDIHGINAITDSGDPMDDNGHGTAMAGIIGAEGNNAIGIAGVMHDVSLIACKFLDAAGGGRTQDAIKCLDYVTDLATRNIGVTIVATSNSWGGSPHSNALQQAIRRHQDLGILFITTSGSSAQNIDKQGLFPARFELANILVVSSATKKGTIASFSNFGPNSVHVAAPGENVLTTWKNDYAKISGSIATSMVAGIVGLIRSQNPQLSWAQTKHRILAGTHQFASPQDRSKVISEGFAHAFSSLTH